MSSAVDSPGSSPDAAPDLSNGFLVVVDPQTVDAEVRREPELVVLRVLVLGRRPFHVRDEDEASTPTKPLASGGGLARCCRCTTLYRSSLDLSGGPGQLRVPQGQRGWSAEGERLDPCTGRCRSGSFQRGPGSGPLSVDHWLLSEPRRTVRILFWLTNCERGKVRSTLLPGRGDGAVRDRVLVQAVVVLCGAGTSTPRRRRSSAGRRTHFTPSRIVNDSLV